jgi:hypothetical protein
VLRLRYELGLCIPEYGVFHRQRRENLKPYIALTGSALYRKRNVFPLRYELGFYIQEGGIIHSNSRGNL